MAIYHFSAQIISRGKGQSAVASASYRSGEKLVDERTGETKFYKRNVEPDTMILTPHHAPRWTKDREKLWNEVERIEKNKNSQLAREINIALPVELSNDEQRKLVRQYVQDQFVYSGMVADVAIHRDDKKNPHAHIMLTIRPFEADGSWGNKKRKIYEFDNDGNKILDQKGKPKYKTEFITDWDQRDTLKKWREEWANYTNRALEKEGIQEKITHLSHEARGLEQLPTIHEGYVAREMEKREAGSSELVKINNEIRAYNKNIIDLSEYRKQKEELEKEIEQAKVVAPVIEKQPELEKEKLIILTEEEKFDLAELKKLLETNSPTYADISKRHEQLDRWQRKLNNQVKEKNNREDILSKAKYTFDKINELKGAVTEMEFKLKNTKNPFKILGVTSVVTKELEKQINDKKSSIIAYEGDIRRLGFTDEEQFKKQFESFHHNEKHEILRDHVNKTERLKKDREILEKGASILDKKLSLEKQDLIKFYPNNPEMAYLDDRSTQYLYKLNQNLGQRYGDVVPLKELSSQYDNVNQHLEKLTKNLNQSESAEKRRSIENEVNKYTNNLDMLGGLLQGIQQASIAMTADRNRSNSTPDYKGKKKRHEQEFELG